MNDQIVEREGFQLIGIKRVCACGSEEASGEIAQLWGEVNANGTVEQLAQLMNGEIKGVLGITDNYDAKANTIDYWVVAEYVGEPPSGFTSLAIPASKWIVFEDQGFAPTAMPAAWKQIYSEWIPSNGYEIADIPAIEAYIDPDPYRDNAVNQIWLAVK